MKNILGKLLSVPIRLLNVPARLMEDFVDPDTDEDDRVFSVPLDRIADGVEGITEYIMKGRDR